MAESGPVLIFDGDCAFCTTAATWIAARLRSDVTAVPWQHADLSALGTDEDRARREVIWSEPGQSAGVVGGAAAVAAALQHATAARWRAAGVALGAPPLRWLGPPVYRLIARNRQRLPGGTPACALNQAAPPR